MKTIEPEGKIFISYRRSDTPGVAGRLSDTLTAYFGEGRVFRDIGGIRAGAKFDDVIDDALTTADALVVLIGQGWLHATAEDGSRRFDDPGDVLTREVAFAMKSGVPVFPVLIEDTRMPSAEELPERLAPLARYNAISISDERWESDVTRLAKIVALDIPGSVAERKLERVRLIVLSVLLATMLYSSGRFAWTSYSGNFFLLSSNDKLTQEQVDDIAKEGERLHRTVPFRIRPFADYYMNEPNGWKGPGAEDLWQERQAEIFDHSLRFFPPLAAVINFVGVGFAAFLLTLNLPYLEARARSYILAAIWTGMVGIVVFLLLYMVSGAPFDTIVVYGGSTAVTTIMLVLMNLSGLQSEVGVESMDQAQYLRERVDDQIAWYGKRSKKNKRAYHVIRIVEILAAASIPLLAGFSASHDSFPLFVGLLGFLVAILAGALTMLQFQENWVQYRSACEALKREKFLFGTGAPPYDGPDDSFKLFVRRIEELLSGERGSWAANAGAKGGESDVVA